MPWHVHAIIIGCYALLLIGLFGLPALVAYGRIIRKDNP